MGLGKLSTGAAACPPPPLTQHRCFPATAPPRRDPQASSDRPAVPAPPSPPPQDDENLPRPTRSSQGQVTHTSRQHAQEAKSRHGRSHTAADLIQAVKF